MVLRIANRRISRFLNFALRPCSWQGGEIGAALSIAQPDDGIGDERRIRGKAPGPDGRWRRMEHTRASSGSALDFKGHAVAGFSLKFVELWFQGIEVGTWVGTLRPLINRRSPPTNQAA